MKYKVWDKVIFKSREDLKEKFDWMYNYAWNIVIIKQVNSFNYNIEGYDHTFDDDVIEWFAEETFEEWELVEVKNDDKEEYCERIFLHMDKNWVPLCIGAIHEKEYEAWQYYCAYVWNQIRKIKPKQIKEYTMEELQEKLWEDFKLVK